MTELRVMRPDAPPRGVTAIASPFVDVERRETRVFPEGVTIAEIVAEMVPPALLADQPMVRVTIDGRVVEAEVWHDHRPPPGAVVIRVLPGRSGVLRSVLLLSATVAAFALGQYYVGPALAEAGLSGFGLTVAKTAATASLMLAGTFLVNALVPVRPPQSTGGAAQSPTYAIAGWRNPINPNGAVPFLLGEHRIAGSHIAFPYRKVVNGENHSVAVLTFGYGPISLSDIRIKDTPIDLYKEIAYEVREGYPTDDPLTIYTQQVFEDELSVELVKGHSDTFGADSRYTAAGATRVTLEASFPGGIIAFTEVQQGNNRVQMQGPWGVQLGHRVRLSTSPDWSQVVDWGVSGMQQRALVASYEWEPPTRGRYEIQFMRRSDDWDRWDQTSQPWKIISRSWWTAIRSYRPEYPIQFSKPVALFDADIRATEQLNGTIDEVNALGMVVCLDWDSPTQSWIVRPTRNPASLFRYVLQGPMNGHPRPDAKIDLPRLQEWHEQNEALGLVYDRYHDYPAREKEVLSDIAAAGRAIPIKRAGKHSVAIDGLKPYVVAHIGPRNATNVTAKRQFVRKPDALSCRFPDRTSNYEMRERLVLRPGFTGDPIAIEDVPMPGVTDPDIVYRELLRRWLEMEYRLNKYFCAQQYEALECEIFDRVRLSYDVLVSTHVQAYVTQVEGTVVRLDEVVTMDAGHTYAVLFRLDAEADGLPDIELFCSIEPFVGETDALYLVNPSTLPNVGDLAMFGLADSVAIDAVVQSIEAGEGFSRHLTLVDYAPQIFDTVDQITPPLWDGNAGVEVSPAIAPPATPIILTVYSTAIAPQGGTTTLFVQLATGPGGDDAASFELQHRLVGAADWTPEYVPIAGGISLSTYAKGDQIELRARAWGFGSPALSSLFTSVVAHTIAATDPVTMHVTSFEVEELSGGTWRFSYALDAQPAGTGVRIKYRAGAWANWSDLTSQFTGVITASPWDSTTPVVGAEAQFTFGAVALDLDGSESGDPIIIQVATHNAGPRLDFSDAANSQYAAIVG